MKRKWSHPNEEPKSKRYWRGFGELEDTPEFRSWLEREFPAGVAEMQSEDDRDQSRRSFLKLMGASTSLAGFGLASCRRPVGKILPYAKHVEWMVPGNPVYYTTAMPKAGGAVPMVIKTFEGRPTHVQGNPLHPASRGGVDAISAASILDMYDPDRAQGFLRKGKASDAKAFGAAVDRFVGGAKSSKGEGVAFLVGNAVSPTLERLRDGVKKQFPEAKFYSYEAVSGVDGDEEAKGLEAVYGKGVTVHANLHKADCVLSLDKDFLGLDAVDAEATAAFSEKRKAEPGEKMNRLYAVENRYTVTGGVADHRLPLPASQMVAMAAALAKEIAKGASAGELAKQAAAVSLDGLGEKTLLWAQEAAKDLLAHSGKAVVLAGSQQPAALHALVAGIIDALKAVGRTVQILRVKRPGYGSLEELAKEVKDGKVKTLWMLGPSNPVYDAPADLKWGELQSGVEEVFCLADRVHATGAAATWFIPAAHYLESWGDVRDADGTYSVVQPMIMPLYGGLSEVEIYLALLGKKKFVAAAPLGSDEEAAGAAGEGDEADPSYVAVRESFAKASASSGAAMEKAWNATLRDGFLAGSSYKPNNGVALKLAKVAELFEEVADVEAPSAGKLEVVFAPDSKIWDGRYVNNGWLQEAPDPIMKLTWDNALLVSPKTFQDLGFEKDGQLAHLRVNDAQHQVAVLRAPGHANASVTLSLGYGQGEEHCGRVGVGTGFDANVFRSQKDLGGGYIASGATLRPAEGEYSFAITGEHYSMEGRALAREGTLEDLNANPSFAKKQGMDSHIPENISLYKGQLGKKSEDNPYGFDYEKEHQWGMTIDLSACTGCNACLISCQSENNIPIVGKEQVKMGREMHWIRLDRYFATPDKTDRDPTIEELENPEMLPQPVACAQCESAPCETVCPVNATVHTEDGLNAMAYNRCIGTRYCANNCPYGARRFNFFDYNKRPLDQLYLGPLSDKDRTGMPESMKLQKNPNVSVRMRGVMEKCTYCVQRLEAAKIKQKQKAKDSNDTRIPTDSVKVACQEVCPAGAIEFGDLANKDSAVNKAKLSGRNYDLLHYLGIAPRTTYLARIKNPNMRMPDAKQVGAATVNMH